MSEFGVPTDEQLTKINKLAKRTLSKDEVFVFSGSSAGDMLIPNRYTKLSPELLEIMVADARHGVSFMFNHSWSEYGSKGIPYGKVFDGRVLSSDKEGQTVELFLDKYIVRDDEMVDGISANALIKRIETGILSDTSIGFGTDKMTCSICGMDYWGGKCSHYRGRKYEMADGTTKTCTVTAMPPSIIIPYNNNALFEESIVWDGAYPGAVVTQSKHGDIIETPAGNYSILEDKEELPKNTLLINHYHNGNIVTMVKKSDHKKIHSLGSIDDKKSKGAEKPMDEKTLKALENLGIEYKEGETTTEEIFTQLADKFAELETLKPQEGQLEGYYMTKEEVVESLGKELPTDEILKLAKEGQEYHKSLSDEAIAMGVRAMGNGFPKETWEKSFENMDTKAIKDIMATWELQANANIPAGRKTNPDMSGKKMSSLPDDAFRVGK